MSSVNLIVIAKEPVPGRVKTRLCPPLSPDQAAALAEAALTDTLAAVGAVPAPRRVIALDGIPGPWLPAGFEVVPQPGGGLGRRLAAAFAAVEPPALLVGMDTPQLTPAALEAACEALSVEGTDAVLGPADDGGYWAIGLDRPAPTVFDEVPMSLASTAERQRDAFRRLGLRWRELETLTDVDEIADAHAVAEAHPGHRFAAAVREAWVAA